MSSCGNPDIPDSTLRIFKNQTKENSIENRKFTFPEPRIQNKEIVEPYVPKSKNPSSSRKKSHRRFKREALDI